MSLAVLGLFVVPMLFAHLPSPAMAGNMAAKLFTVQTWISVVCALGLLLAVRHGEHAPWPGAAGQSMTLWVLAGMLLALLVEFAVAPRIVARDNLRLWHSVGSVMYLAQWLCALRVFGGMAAQRPAA